MNNKIKILDHHEAIKIAAGEVIERPANIIKELLENSIDAGAKNISLHLQSAGKKMIKIVDDGCGMSSEDALLCFAHHATSKIKSVQDLTNITTYGFRGEALSSIAAVSRTELMTKTDQEKVGTHIVFQHSQCIKQEQIAHSTGTTFIITDLFENIPARKKFLKSDDTEWNQIVTIFQAFCLRYGNINFKLFHNDYLSYNCNKTDNIQTRAAQLWSNNLHDQLIEITSKTIKNITIHGAISTPHYYRFNRGQIFIFVNNRWIKNNELMKGILEGYQGVLPHQKYPAVFLNIEINSELIDINIHPKKEEVKFLHPGIAQQVVTTTVKETLNNFISQKISTNINPQKEIDPQIWSSPILRPTSKTEDEQWLLESIQQSLSAITDDPQMSHPSTFENYDGVIKKQKLFEQSKAQANQSNSPKNIFRSPFLNEAKTTEIQDIKIVPKTSQINIKKESPKEASQVQINKTFLEEPSFSIIGQFNKTYIIIEQNNELILVDQHAAHERIIYQRLKIQGQIPSVQLMFPHIIKIAASTVTKILDHIHLLSEHGIMIDQLSESEIIITATPIGIQVSACHEIIMMIADLFEEEVDLKNLQLNEKIIITKACKTACKAGDILEITQMQNLIKELMITQDRFCCPHGRPTMYPMMLKEIEKHFKRNYVGTKEKNISML